MRGIFKIEDIDYVEVQHISGWGENAIGYWTVVLKKKNK